MGQKLNQVVAAEKSIKSRTHSDLSKLHHLSQKVDLYNGFSKTYTPKDEDGEVYPNETKKVQLIANEVFDDLISILSESLNITATKDYANCNAFADVVVDGNVIIEKAPTSFLLFLEKQIVDIKTFVEKIPELDTVEDWKKDINTGLYKTDVVQTHRQKKIPKVIVRYEATKEHPAQTDLINEDVLVGYWNTIKHSGAIPVPDKKKVLNKIEKLAIAVKYARESANSSDAPNIDVSTKLFNYLF